MCFSEWNLYLVESHLFPGNTRFWTVISHTVWSSYDILAFLIGSYIDWEKKTFCCLLCSLRSKLHYALCFFSWQFDWFGMKTFLKWNKLIFRNNCGLIVWTLCLCIMYVGSSYHGLYSKDKLYECSYIHNIWATFLCKYSNYFCQHINSFVSVLPLRSFL